MLQTQVFNSFAQRSSTGAIRFLAATTFFGGAYGFAWHQYLKQQQQLLYDKVESDITEWKPYTLKGPEAVQYPWAQENFIREWEYRLVKLYGFFRVLSHFSLRTSGSSCGESAKGATDSSSSPRSSRPSSTPSQTRTPSSPRSIS